LNKISFEQNQFRTKSVSNKIRFEQNQFRTKSVSNKISFEQNQFWTKSVLNKISSEQNRFRTKSVSNKISFEQNQFRTKSCIVRGHLPKNFFIFGQQVLTKKESFKCKVGLFSSLARKAITSFETSQAPSTGAQVCPTDGHSRRLYHAQKPQKRNL
jgi:hypothetical protein